MDWPSTLGLILSGGVGTALVNVAVQGWRGKQAAKNVQENEHERTTQKMLIWMSEYYRMRSLAFQHGATAEEVGEPPLELPEAYRHDKLSTE